MTEEQMIAAGYECDGCGSRETLEQIKAEHPRAYACCPERKLVPSPLMQLYLDLLDAQEPLGDEFARIWSENVEALYEE